VARDELLTDLLAREDLDNTSEEIQRESFPS
jgi:hypothetical protein